MKNVKNHVAFLAKTKQFNIGSIMETVGIVVLATGVAIRRSSINKKVLFCNKEAWMKLYDCVDKIK